VSRSAALLGDVTAETVDASTRVRRLIRVFGEGSTSPALAETAAGDLYVLKFAGAGPGPRALLTEFLAMQIAGRLGVHVPETRALYLPSRFPWQIGTDEFDDLVQRSAGWNLGVRFVPNARDLCERDLPALPDTLLESLAVSDRLLQNVDRTRANPNLIADLAGAVWAIDYGACLFLERLIAGRPAPPVTLPFNHFLAGTPFDSADRGYDRTDAIAARDIEACIAIAPASWLASVPMPPPALSAQLSAHVEAAAGASSGKAKTRSEAPMPRSG
jgi:hypothetical protein